MTYLSYSHMTCRSNWARQALASFVKAFSSSVLRKMADHF